MTIAIMVDRVQKKLLECKEKKYKLSQSYIHKKLCNCSSEKSSFLV